MTARSGAFNNGSLTVRRNTDESDNLGKEFAILRDEAADNKIEQHEKHLRNYEDRLRKKFIKMEKAMAGAKSQRSWLNSQLGNKNEK